MQIKYSFGRNTFDNTPRQNVAESWEDFLNETYTRDDGIRSTKKGQEFVCSPFAKGTTQQHQEHADHWRGKDLAQPMAVAFQDFDKFDSEAAFDATVARMKALHVAGLIHETSSSRQKTEKNPEGFPRARAAVLLSREVTRHEYAEVQMVISYDLGALLDRAVLKIEQPIYLPLRGQEVTVFEGDPYDVEDALRRYEELCLIGEIDDAHAMSNSYRAGAEATSSSGELIEADTLIRVGQDDSEMTFLELFRAFDDLKHDGANGKGIRCGTPWRDSDSGCAGVFIVHDRTAFIHDVGDGENHYPVEAVMLECFPEMDAAKVEDFDEFTSDERSLVAQVMEKMAGMPADELAEDVSKMLLEVKGVVRDVLAEKASKIIGCSAASIKKDIKRLEDERKRKALAARLDKDYAKERVRRKEERMAIGEGGAELPKKGLLPYADYLDRFVHITGTNEVVDLADPRRAVPMTVFHGTHKQDKHESGNYSSLVWQEDPMAKSAEVLTFRAGGDLYTSDPEGRMGINSWKAPYFLEKDFDFKDAGDPKVFFTLVNHLFDSKADKFLDWLADGLVNPGRLPSWGWLHVSSKTGTGRGLLMCILARLMPGYVAAGVDLGMIIDQGFNERLSRKVFAIVEEIRTEAAGKNRYKTEEAVKEMITAPQRIINPKMGKQHSEHNCCRWLICSNHENALPISDTDRRLDVVINEKAPMTPAFYAKAYEMLDDPAFIEGIVQALIARDLSNFKPGLPPVMDDAKRKVIKAGQSEADVAVAELLAAWPCDVIRAGSLAEVLNVESLTNGAVRYALQSAGARKFEKPVRVGDKIERLYALRNPQKWMSAKGKDVAAELLRGEALLPEGDDFTNMRDRLDILLAGSQEEVTDEFDGF